MLIGTDEDKKKQFDAMSAVDAKTVCRIAVPLSKGPGLIDVLRQQMAKAGVFTTANIDELEKGK